MENVSPKKFRAELKDYLERAVREPIRLTRRSGESYVLMNENEFLEMKDEIMSLQSRLLSMSEILAGETEEYIPGDKSRLDKLKNKKRD